MWWHISLARRLYVAEIWYRQICRKKLLKMIFFEVFATDFLDVFLSFVHLPACSFSIRSATIFPAFFSVSHWPYITVERELSDTLEHTSNLHTWRYLWSFLAINFKMKLRRVIPLTLCVLSVVWPTNTCVFPPAKYVRHIPAFLSRATYPNNICTATDQFLKICPQNIGWNIFWHNGS